MADLTLAPDLLSRLDALLAVCPGASVTSGRRTLEQQTALYQACLQERGSAAACRSWVAVPGTSLHERGLAVDVSGGGSCLDSQLSALGLCRPLPNEPWHIELCPSGAAMPVATSAPGLPVFSVDVWETLFPDGGVSWEEWANVQTSALGPGRSFGWVLALLAGAALAAVLNK